jgi:phosphate transport system permease protein
MLLETQEPTRQPEEARRPATPPPPMNTATLPISETKESVETKSRPVPPAPRESGGNAFADALFTNLTRGAALLVFSLLAAIMLSLVAGAGMSIMAFGPKFLWTAEWDPVGKEFGALVPIFGTLATAAIAMIIAVPVSFGIALFLTELSPKWLKRPLGTAIELLAAIPSIIYGMWGLFVFGPLFMEYVQPFFIKTLGAVPGLGMLFAGPPMGIGMFTAGLILSIMVIPFITAVMRDVFELVPPMLKESAYGLGGTTWEVMYQVVLPYTKVGVVGGVMLGLGRALGETMAVTFVIGNAHQLGVSLFAPGNSIASALANEFTEAVDPLHSSALIELGLILFLITTIVLAASKFMLSRLARQEGARS